MMSTFSPTIIRSKRRSISIQITEEGNIIVHAPFLMPNFFINQFLEERKEWISKTQEKIAKKTPKRKTYAEGEEFLYLGKQLPLQFVNTHTITVSDALYFPSFLSFRIKKELESWYVAKAKDVISKRVEYHAANMGATYKSIMFSDTKSKWGSCGPDNSLQFNWRLIMAPLIVIDYVVIHELAHTFEKNHGKSFWTKVSYYTPAYRQHKKWLKDNASHMYL